MKAILATFWRTAMETPRFLVEVPLSPAEWDRLPAIESALPPVTPNAYLVPRTEYERLLETAAACALDTDSLIPNPFDLVCRIARRQALRDALDALK